VYEHKSNEWGRGFALVEAATALLLVFRRPEGVPLAAALPSLALVAVIWLSTSLLHVPRYTTLGTSFDRRANEYLVLSHRGAHRRLELAGCTRFVDGRSHHRIDGDIRWRRATRSGTYNPKWQKKFKRKRRMASWVTGEWR
jgi:hypothetical protein